DFHVTGVQTCALPILPVGFKNTTDGDVGAAVDACVAAAAEHVFFGADSRGRAAAVATRGNADCHVILRGGRSGPNYGAEVVARTLELAQRAGLDGAAAHGVIVDASHGNSGKDHVRQAEVVRGGRSGPNDAAAVVARTLELAQRAGLDGAAAHGVIVDASHGNSGKDHVRQAEVVRELAARLAAGEQGITGLMLESFLVAGAQAPAPSGLVYGQSVTDKCMDWGTTAELLDELAAAVRARRVH